MHAFTWIFLAALGLSTGLQWWLIGRHQRHITAHRAAVPPAFAGRITLQQHQRAADYTLARTGLARIDIAIESMLLLAFTLGGGIQFLHEQLAAIVQQPLLQGVLLIAVFTLLSSLLQLPISWYRTFRLEQRFGFNTQTPGLFWADQLKGAVLGLVTEMPLTALILWLFVVMGSLWWLWSWLAIMAFMLLMFAIMPIWIAPLFNKFTPLADTSLQQRIEALLQRCGFAASGVFVMDGSTRSRHGNAYFTGFGRNKRIVFFDTLIEQLSADEIEAVLAHELGHYHHGHIKQLLLLIAAAALGGMWLLGVLVESPWFYHGLGVEAQTPALALLLFNLTLPLALVLLRPLTNLLSRRNEFQADRFAVSHTRYSDLVSALVKLYAENASTLTPDPLYSAVYDSHPPAPIRIAALERLGRPT